MNKRFISITHSKCASNLLLQFTIFLRMKTIENQPPCSLCVYLRLDCIYERIVYTCIQFKINIIV